MPISSDARTLDGLNVQVAVCDKSPPTRRPIYDALRTAMGKRRHPLLLSISTATGSTSGIGKQLSDYSVRVLEAAQSDDRLFARCCTIDRVTTRGLRDMDQGNPGWGVSVCPMRCVASCDRHGTTQRRKPLRERGI
jgi:phage terminase large subunit-like protein